jgi:outer membrane lipoprotein-sorting protein
MNGKLWLGVALLTISTTFAHAQTPRRILNRAKAVYQSAKTYQATYSVTVNTEPPDRFMKGTIQSQGRKFRHDILTRNKTTTIEQTVIFDGKRPVMYFALPDTKQYSQVPIKGSIGGRQGLPLISIQTALSGKLKRLADERLANHPMYVIEAQAKGETLRLYVDKKTHRLKRFIRQAQKTRMVETYLSEKFNAPIPAKTFVYTPPAGAKRIK